jgi:DNA-binding response OmpR family regulator
MSDERRTACRVLVVEDELLLAATIELVLEDLSYEIVGPVPTLEKALKLARDERFDVAILDVTIRGGKVYPVAEVLLARGIPFVFASGYGEWALPEALRDQPRLTKPFTAAELEAQLRLLCSAAKNRGDADAERSATG